MYVLFHDFSVFLKKKRKVVDGFWVVFEVLGFGSFWEGGVFFWFWDLILSFSVHVVVFVFLGRRGGVRARRRGGGEGVSGGTHHHTTTPQHHHNTTQHNTTHDNR